MAEHLYSHLLQLQSRQFVYNLHFWRLKGGQKASCKRAISQDPPLFEGFNPPSHIRHHHPEQSNAAALFLAISIASFPLLAVGIS
jgi:hypothetical protein